MIKFFRHIRQNLLIEGQTAKYLKYAVGEILLVVIGILIAVSINNWNSDRKAIDKKKQYTISLVDELTLDLTQLNRLDSAARIYIQTLDNYIAYYNKPDKSIDSLVARLKQIRSRKSFFNSQAFTIDDLLSTGNLSLFDQDIRKAIIRLKQTQQINAEYERKSAEGLTEFETTFQMNNDLFYEAFGSVPEHSDVRGWKEDINSTTFRFHNNMVIRAVGFHNYQLDVHDRIHVKTKELITLLQNELK